MTFVIGTLFVRETKDVDIYARRSLTASASHRPGRPRKRRPFFMCAGQANSAACCSRSRFFCTLPMALRGSSATTKQRLGTLKLAMLRLQRARSARRRRARAPARGDDDRHDRLAEVGVRHADHRALGHAGHSLM